MSRGELGALLSEMGEPAYRANQLFSWLHKKQAESFSQMSDLPAPLRASLEDGCYIDIPVIEKKLVSEKDGTVKYLLRLRDGACVESVLMRYKYGLSLCISSQVGCRMGCSFCASTKAGLVRSLSSGEMEGQINRAQLDSGERVSHVVLMGIGEPLDNLDNVLRFLELACDEDGLNLSMRNISLSTCGVVDGIERLMEKNLPITLSVSLHAPNNEVRNSIMPVNRAWDIDKLLDACGKYYRRTGRRISFEYAMIEGVNDSGDNARELARRLKPMSGAHVNIIPVNSVRETDYKRSGQKRVRAFTDILGAAGINATVRRELGSDISAACGQLRHDTAAKKGD